MKYPGWTIVLVLLALLVAMPACRVTPTQPQIQSPVPANVPQVIVENTSRHRLKVFCDGEEIATLAPGETRSFDTDGCERIGYLLVR